jgi:hypothetical protein
MFFIECGLLFRNFQLIDHVLVTSFKSFIGACVGARAKRVRWWRLRSTRWLARAKRVRWGDWKYALDMRVGWHALGTPEARAFSGFNEHPLVNYN